VYIRCVKTILLLRHAKAEALVPGQRDFDRPLASRGRDDAQLMGRVLAKLGCVPDAIVSSPAARAKETAEGAARAMKFGGKIIMEPALYDAAGEVWLDTLRAVASGAASALLVAHEPGMSEAAGLLCGGDAGTFDIPTAGLLSLEVNLERWRDLAEGDAALRWFLRPKTVAALL
jgi:phosphohistidine phosphatase